MVWTCASKGTAATITVGIAIFCHDHSRIDDDIYVCDGLPPPVDRRAKDGAVQPHMYRVCYARNICLLVVVIVYFLGVFNRVHSGT
jgi:hypothetical protein